MTTTTRAVPTTGRRPRRRRQQVLRRRRRRRPRPGRRERRWRPASSPRSWGRPVPASPPSSTCSPASTSRPPGGCTSATPTSAGWATRTSRSCAGTGSASSSSRSTCCPPSPQRRTSCCRCGSRGGVRTRGGSTPSSTRWASASGSVTGRASSPAASSSGWPRPGPWPGARRSSSPTSPRGAGLRSGAALLGFLRTAVTELRQTVVMVTHDPVAASYADRVLFLADGRIVDEVTDPTAEAVLDYMKHLGA